MTPVGLGVSLRLRVVRYLGRVFFFFAHSNLVRQTNMRDVVSITMATHDFVDAEQEHKNASFHSFAYLIKDGLGGMQ